MTTIMTFDPKELEAKVKAMYRSVAENPKGDFHFEMGRAMAERLGYARVEHSELAATRIASSCDGQIIRILRGHRSADCRLVAGAVASPRSTSPI
jgi:hypothetical protein